MQADDPPYLPDGTDVSAKYKGAFCEAKIKKVVRNIKCKVTFKGVGAGSTTVSDEAIKGTLRVGNTVEVKLDQKKEALEALITKIQDCSQYTVVFDDGDITTLRRSALCLKSGRHFAESETLDQLPLTHPEHFGNPVIGSSGRRGRRTNRTQSDDSDSDASESTGTGTGIGSTVTEREPHAGRVVLVQCSTADKKRGHHSHQWFPGLVVAPNAQETVKIKVKDDYLVRSFKDGRYYTVPKKEAREFRRNSASTEWGGMEAALLYIDQGVLPTHWDKDILFGQESHSQSDEADSDDSMDDEPHEEKDHFVAQLYKFMDDRGTPLNRQPTISNKDVDLYRLFNAVQKLGGYNRVTNQNKWKRIATRLGFQPASTNVINLCRQAYKRYLHSFEEFYRKLGVTLLSNPRSGRTTGRSLIRDRDKMHSSFSQKSASPAPVSSTSDEKVIESTSGKASSTKTKEKDVEKEIKKEKEVKVKEIEAKETKEKEVKSVVKKEEIKEKETKDIKEVKEVKTQEKEKEKEPKTKEKSRDVKEKETKEKEVKEKVKEKETSHKVKQKEIKVKPEPVVSSEEDSGDNQPLVPMAVKIEKVESPTPEKNIEKAKVQDTPKSSKLFKSASGTIDVKRTEKSSAKKITQRRNSLPRCNPSGNKSDSNTSNASSKEGRCKSSLSDTPAPTKKQSLDLEKTKDKESTSITSSTKKHTSSSDKNDSDSSSRGSKNGKISSRRNAPSNESTPPSTPSSSNIQLQSNKKPRKRKITDTINANDTTIPQMITADIGDKLKVYYGPTHPESKVTYEAKVIEIDGKGSDALLRVHYTGWNTRYDEWIKPSRIAENLTQHSKNKHKDKGKRSVASSGSGSSDSNMGKKSRISQSPSVPPPLAVIKPHTRNRGMSGNPTSNQSSADNMAQSDSDSDDESDSSSQRQLKKTVEENKPPSIEKARTPEPSPSLIEKPLETPPKEKSKISKIIKTPQMKRLAEGSQSRVKRTRLKPDDNLSPRGRDYDLNEIRSELKGLETTSKSPAKDSSKVEAPSQPSAEDSKISYKSEKPEKTPEKVTEDIYEFKEPEPFEFEARKSEEKKKRLPTHRIFDEIAPPSIPQLKLSPTPPPEKPQEVEKICTKSRFDTTFDKLCQGETYEIIAEGTSTIVEKDREGLSLFSEIAGEDSGDRLLMETESFSQEPIFTYEPELFPDKAYTPIFKGFTPAKNQETYSKKDAASKLQDIDDDFTNSPIKGEQSSDEDPIDAAIQRVNAHSMSDDSNDGELLIKTPATPTVPTGGLLASFSSEPPDTVETEIKSEKTDNIPKSKLEGLLKLKPEILPLKPTEIDPLPLLEKQNLLPDFKTEPKTTAMEVCDTSIDSKIESDCTSSFADVIMPEPPAGFLIHKEGPSIAEKVLRAISSAKKGVPPPISKDIVKISKPDPIKIPKSISPKNLNLKLLIQKPSLPEQSKDNVTSTSSSIIESTVTSEIKQKTETKLESLPANPKVDVIKKDIPIVPEIITKSEIIPTKPEVPTIALIKKESIERRKSTAETALGGKSNRVLSETIQKLSSQISQPTPPIPIPEYQTDDRSDTTDSDDSDRRLIIDKLSEEESQSCISLSENSTSQPSKVPVDKLATQWSNVDSNQDTDNEKSSNVPESSTKESITKPLEEDSNISLLLCEETIPGSPAPENLGEAVKNVQSKARTRNMDIPFASAPSTCPDEVPKESSAAKDPPKEKDAPKECREVVVGVRNERGSREGNNSSAETVMDNTPPTTPESSLGNNSPASRDQHLSDAENVCEVKVNEDNNSRILAPSKKINEIDTGTNIRNSGPNSPVVGPRRGRRPRGCRLSDSEDQNIGLAHSNAHRPLKYNFFVDLDPMLDGTARIALITSRLSELRKVYHTLKAELATIDRRRKKLRRKEREAIKAAKAACS